MKEPIYCEEIFSAALARMEEPTVMDRVDYAERAPYLIAAFVSEAAAIDKLLREKEGLHPAEDASPVYIPLADRFPLCGRLAAPASLYLASMLLLDSDELTSDKLYSLYCDAMSDICSSLPASAAAIADIYGF